MLTDMEVGFNQGLSLCLFLAAGVARVRLSKLPHLDKFRSFALTHRLPCFAGLAPDSTHASFTDYKQKDEKEAVTAEGCQVSANVCHIECFERDVGAGRHLGNCLLYSCHRCCAHTRRSIEEFVSCVLTCLIEELLGGRVEHA